MFHIGDVEIKTPLIIAPLAGVSNGAFRDLCYDFGASLTYTEMISDKAIFYNNKKTLDMLEIGERHPISVQLFGSDIETMVYSAQYVEKNTRADIIDINMGCPVNKVVKTGAGSAMMLKEDETAMMVKRVCESVKLPVSVKMRIGYDKQHCNCLSLAKKLEDAGVKAIAIHGRTRSQFYEGQADWSYIKLLKDNLSIPVIGNGDVLSVEDFIRMKEETNADGIMIGRGVIGNPFLIAEINNYLNGKENYEVAYNERFAACIAHCERLSAIKGETAAMREMRGIAPHYISGLYNCSNYKRQMALMSSLKELKDILGEYEKNLVNRPEDVRAV